MINRALYLRRRVANSVFIVLSIAAAIFGLIWLGFILGSLLDPGRGRPVADPVHPIHAAAGIGKAVLANAILGSVLMSVLAVLVGTPIGLFAGTYLAEYGKHTRFAFVVRFVNDILLSAPVHRHRPVHL